MPRPFALMPAIVRSRRRTATMSVLAPLVFASVDGSHLSVLPDPPGPRGTRTTAQAAIEGQPVCIGSSVASVGDLSNVLYYRAVARDDVHVEVGYFAFFSEERPWGNNWLTWTVLPAVVVDSVYSRALLVAPGLQRAFSGAGDVEGVRVLYDIEPDGSLSIDHAVADDGRHDPVLLSRDEVLALDPKRPTFYSDVWSHQLGGRGARSRADLAYVRCYADAAIRPLPDSVARAFHIEDHDRAPPAHVDRFGGRRLDLPGGDVHGDGVAGQPASAARNDG